MRVRVKGAATDVGVRAVEREGLEERTARAALAYAAVATLDPSDPRRRRCWRALRLAVIGMAAEIRERRAPTVAALVSRRSAAPPTLRYRAAP